MMKKKLCLIAGIAILFFNLSITHAQEVIWEENFDDLENQTTWDKGSTQWATLVPEDDEISINNQKLRFQRVLENNNWFSEPILIRNYDSVRISFRVDGVNIDAPDWIRVFYQIDNQPLVQIYQNQNNGSFSDVVTSNEIAGDYLKITIQSRILEGGEFFEVDDIIVSGVEREENEYISIWEENFSGLENGIKSKQEEISWSMSDIDRGGGGIWGVENEKLVSFCVNDGEEFWVSNIIDISAYDNVNISTLLSVSGREARINEHLKVYYSIDHGEPILLENGALENETNTSKMSYVFGLEGSTLQIIVKSLNNCTNNYSLHQLKVFGNSRLERNSQILWSQNFNGYPDGIQHNKEENSWAVTTYEWNEQIGVFGERFVFSDVRNASWSTGIIDISGFENIRILTTISGQNIRNDDELTLYYQLDNNPIVEWGSALQLSDFVQLIASEAFRGDKLQIFFHANVDNDWRKYFLEDIVVIGQGQNNNRQIIWNEKFHDVPDQTLRKVGDISWDCASRYVVRDRFSIQDERLKLIGKTDRGRMTGVWSSEIIDISSFEDIDISIASSGVSTRRDLDYLRVYYQIDGGDLMLLPNGDIDGGGDLFNRLVNITNLNGRYLKVIIEGHVESNIEEYYIIDEVLVTGNRNFNQNRSNQAQIWKENFVNLPDRTLNDEGETSWSIDSGGNIERISVEENRIRATRIFNNDVWRSENINISEFADIVISIAISGGGLDEGDDYLRAYYSIDGGDEILFPNGEIDGGNTFGKFLQTREINGETIQIAVHFRNDDNEYHYLNEVLVSGIRKWTPLAPANFLATSASTSEVDLTWFNFFPINNGDETHFIVEKTPSLELPFERLAELDPNTVQFTDQNLEPNTTYYYRAKTVNRFFSSEYTEPDSATTWLLTPENFQVLKNPQGQAELSWEDIEGETQYIVLQSLEQNGEAINFIELAQNTTRWVDQEARVEEVLWYRVKAVNDRTVSAATEPLKPPTYYYSIQDGDWQNVENWSLSPDQIIPVQNPPTEADNIIIQGHKISVKKTEECASILIQDGEEQPGKLIISGYGNKLTVGREIRLSRAPEQGSQLVVDHGGELIILQPENEEEN